MKKVMREFFQVIGYCFEILWETSRRYFIIRIFLNMVSLIVPFAVIVITRSLMNFLADGNMSVSDTVIKPFLALSLLLVGCNILNKAVETANTYYVGLHLDTMDTAMKQRI